MLKFSEIFEFSRKKFYFERIRTVRMVRMVRSLADRTFQLRPLRPGGSLQADEPVDQALAERRKLAQKLSDSLGLSADTSSMNVTAADVMTLCDMIDKKGKAGDDEVASSNYRYFNGTENDDIGIDVSAEVRAWQAEARAREAGLRGAARRQTPEPATRAPAAVHNFRAAAGK